MLLHTNEHVTSLVQELRLWELNGLGHLVHLLLDDGLLSLHCQLRYLVDLLLNDGLLSLHCQLSDFRLLHFNCVDDVLNVRVCRVFSGVRKTGASVIFTADEMAGFLMVC